MMKDLAKVPSPARRTWMLGGLALAASALTGCGGGGGGSGGGGGGGGGGSKTGHLVFRNSGRVAVWAFATGTEVVFDPGTEPFIDPGVTVSSNGTITVARDGDNSGFSSALYNLSGTQVDILDLARPFAFQKSAVVFNPPGTLGALALDEPRSDSDNTRVSRTLVFDADTGSLVATLEGFDEPVWAGTSGDLFLRRADETNTDDHTLYVTTSAFGTPTSLGFSVSRLIGDYESSPNGDVIVYGESTQIRARNRRTNATWLAVTQDPANSYHSPVLSPDGNWLALLARSGVVFVPHVVPFAAGSSVTLVSTEHEVDTSLADCTGRMGWTAA